MLVILFQELSNAVKHGRVADAMFLINKGADPLHSMSSTTRELSTLEYVPSHLLLVVIN